MDYRKEGRRAQSSMTLNTRSKKDGRKTRRVWLTALLLLPMAVMAQLPPITMDQEPHHQLVTVNNFVKVFKVDLASRDALSMHRHDYDDVSIALGDATTVSMTPDQ